MSSNRDSAAYLAKRQTLINLALKKDPVLLRPKTGVSFANDSPPTDRLVNELPRIDRHGSVISVSHVPVDELPSVSSIIKTTSARSISTLSGIS